MKTTVRLLEFGTTRPDRNGVFRKRKESWSRRHFGSIKAAVEWLEDTGRVSRCLAVSLFPSGKLSSRWENGKEVATYCYGATHFKVEIDRI